MNYAENFKNIKRIDTDKSVLTNQGGVIPRRPELKYASMEASRAGLIPIEAYPDVLINEKDYKEVINDCHEKEMFPVYHQYASWCPKGFSYNQNGLGYCWTWSGTGNFMDTRAVEDKDTVLLSPVSMGYLVNWANEGNYLEDFIKGAKNHGICTVDCIGEGLNSTNRSPKTYCDNWEEIAYDFRLDQVWDTDYSNTKKMIQHCISILAYGRSLYIAYDWWGHAVNLVGVVYDESQVNNLVWLIRNSHGESDVIEMVGSKAVPSEAYGFISTALTGK